MKANARVLHRNEAHQMITDLGDAIENVIMLAGEMDDTDKVIAVDTLILLQSKRYILQGEIASADRDAAERDLATLTRAAEHRGAGVQP